MYVYHSTVAVSPLSALSPRLAYFSPNTQVLVFRGQENLTPERHVEFSRCFGDLYCHVIGASRLVVITAHDQDSRNGSL